MNIETCKDILHNEGLTCVVADEIHILYKSDRKSILPMLEVLELYQKGIIRPIYQADRIIGKAAVIIAAECGIQEIYTDVISQTALDIAERKGIHVSYDQSVEKILNRTQTAEGPFEAALHDVDENDFDFVLKTIYTTLDTLGIHY